MASDLTEKSSLAAWIPVLLLGVIAGWILLHDLIIRDRSPLSTEMSGSPPHSGSPTLLPVGTGISHSQNHR